MRLFFALNISENSKLAIQHWMQSNLPYFDKPVAASNYHITLAFLGSTEQKQLDTLCQIAEGFQCAVNSRFALKQPKLHLVLDLLGHWPKPQIVWLGPSYFPQGLIDFSQKLARQSSRLGFAIDKRPYQPHITLARKCNAPIPHPLTLPNIDLEISEFSLFESISGSQGIQYQAVESWSIPLLSE
jgi:2'-5' RNA ligase